MKAAVGRTLEMVVPPACVLTLGVAGWHLASDWIDKPYLLPAPDKVLKAAVDPERQLFAATRWTAQAAFAGLAASLVVGTLVALLFSSFRWVRRAAFPFTIVFQTVPVVAIAPLIIVWFGTGFTSVVIVAFVLSVFPVISSTTQGLVRVDRRLHELFTSYGASRWQLLIKLRLPLAIPYVVAGARVASGLAVIGAIVGEFFAGYGATQYGLGYLIQATNNQMRIDALFAAVAASTALGLLWFSAVSAIGQAVLARWSPEQGDH